MVCLPACNCNIHYVYKNCYLEFLYTKPGCFVWNFAPNGIKGEVKRPITIWVDFERDQLVLPGSARIGAWEVISVRLLVCNLQSKVTGSPSLLKNSETQLYVFLSKLGQTLAFLDKLIEEEKSVFKTIHMSSTLGL